MQVFIVRPFGNRPVLKKDKTGTVTQVMFDFDRVENELVQPALKELNLQGGTTGKIFEAGSIHEDMFNELLLADIVIADITVHNANVFYELGIRHTLRDRKTVLLKCPGYDETPFDITGFKYLAYDVADPAKTLDQLVKVLEETIAADRADSPVFKWIPKLESQDPEEFLAIPSDFLLEVKVAFETEQIGKLLLLAAETEGFTWQIPALRIVGKNLSDLKKWDAARAVWEQLKARYTTDRQANEMLVTIYQRLSEREKVQNHAEGTALLVLSDQAADSLTNNESLNNDQRAESLALKARNAKTKWLMAWKDIPPHEKDLKAFQSVHLDVAYKLYEQGYLKNLNHFYSGINALGLLTIIITLAERYPDQWVIRFNKPKEADQQLEDLKERKQTLMVSIPLSIEAARRKLETEGGSDTWLEITEADFTCLVETRAQRVTLAYQKALENAKSFQFEAARRQLAIYEQLNISPDNVQAALSVVPQFRQTIEQPIEYFLFTGHMIDKPDRKEPRFPASKESAVKEKLREVVSNQKDKTKSEIIGISGGACGGDILFHEVCAELGIKTEMYLAIPASDFITASVSFAGSDWVQRFNTLYNSLPHPVLSFTKVLPKWLRKKENYAIWERNNLWELNSALVNGGMHMTLIALWDGKGGDGAGGTADMVKEAKRRGAVVIEIDITKL